MFAGSTLRDVTEAVGLVANERTLACACLADRLLLQVTHRRMHLFSMDAALAPDQGQLQGLDTVALFCWYPCLSSYISGCPSCFLVGHVSPSSFPVGKLSPTECLPYSSCTTPLNNISAMHHASCLCTLVDNSMSLILATTSLGNSLGEAHLFVHFMPSRSVNVILHIEINNKHIYKNYNKFFNSL